MKSLFTILTLCLIVIGFYNPFAWVGAVIALIIAMGSKPEGKRADGKPKTGGLLGSLWDDFDVSTSMTECPFCKSKISNDALKCSHCGEWVKEGTTQQNH